MTNHCHLLIEPLDGNLSNGMRQINGIYTQSSNRPPPLSQIASASHNRKAAILAAYATGAYSYRAIAEHFGIHLATVGRTRSLGVATKRELTLLPSHQARIPAAECPEPQPDRALMEAV